METDEIYHYRKKLYFSVSYEPGTKNWNTLKTKYYLFKDNFFINDYIGNSYLMREKNNKGENAFFDDTLNTFYLWLYGDRPMVKDYSERERKSDAATIWATLSS